MDVEKLLRIIIDLLAEEQKFSTVSYLDQIRNNIAQNNAGGHQEARSQFEKLKEEMEEKSVTMSFSGTENKILDAIKATNFFGKGLLVKVDSIINGSTFDALQQIDQFKQERLEFINKLERSRNSLIEINVSDYRPDQYEVGIIIPKDLDTTTLISKNLKDFTQLVNAIQELAGVTSREVHITRISNGSLEFFTSQPVEVVLVITTILANVSQIWDKINSLKKRQEEINDDQNLSAKSKKDIKKIIEDDIKAIKTEIEEGLPEKIISTVQSTLDVGRKNEIRNQIKAKIKVVFAWFEVGVEIDVVPIRLEQSGDTNEVPDQIKTQQVELLKNIKDVNYKLSEIYKLPTDVKKLPFKLSDAPTTGEDVE